MTIGVRQSSSVRGGNPQNNLKLKVTLNNNSHKSMSRKNNRSPYLDLKSDEECQRLNRPKTATKMAPTFGSKNKDLLLIQKNGANSKHQVYYNPVTKGEEIFVKREDVPNLEPLWGDDKGEARDKIYSFLNKQNLRIVKQIEPKSCSKMLESVGDPTP